jgi:hypothetical protein
MSANSISPGAKDVSIVTVLPFTVLCHDQPLEVDNTGTFRSSNGREMKVILTDALAAKTLRGHDGEQALVRG